MARLEQQRRELNRNALHNAVGGQLQRSYEELVASDLPDNLASLLMQLDSATEESPHERGCQ
jgi:hypothetical protein